MKCIGVLLVVIALVAAHKIDEEDDVPDIDIRKVDSRREFARFIRKFRGSRGNLRSNDEVKKRYQIFSRNVDSIKKHNKKGSSFRMEINEFADKSLRERHLYTGLANVTNALQKRSLSKRSALQLREA